MKNRNIALAIVFSIITCGIYGIYWFVVLTNDMNSLSTSDGFETSGGMALLFTIITCGIYGFYWSYKMGAKLNEIHGKDESNQILFLILQLFGLSIVNMCILQSEVNSHA